MRDNFMKRLHQALVPAIALAALVFGSMATTTASAADWLGSGNSPARIEAATLHIGPGYRYDVLTTIRAGTAPRLHFCEYHGRWCYGSYGRFNGWYFGGNNTWDHWSLGYWR